MCAPPPSPLNAIVIDDHAPSARAIAGLLAGLGCSSITCVDAPSSVAQAIDATVDLVTLDLRMPGLDGFEVLALIRSHEHSGRRSGVPVVVISGMASAADKAQSLSAGCIAHLGKPVERTALADVLARVHALGGELRRACHTVDSAAILEWLATAVARAGGDRVRVVAGMAMVFEQQGMRLLHETLLAAYEGRLETGRQAARELAALAESAGAGCLHNLCLELAISLAQCEAAFETAAVRARAELDRMVFTLRHHALA
jgi:CheY-like chemotaxis protein